MTNLKVKQVDTNDALVITSNTISEMNGAPTHKELMRTIKNYILNGYLIEYESVKKTPSQDLQETTPLIVKKSKYLTKQGKNVNNYSLSNKAAVFISAKFSDEVRLKLVNLLEAKTIENYKLKNDLIELQQVQLEQYKKQFSITDNRVVIFDESNIPDGYIKFSEILRRTTSGLPKSRIQEILLAMQVPYVEYNSTYESSDGFIHKGKLAKAFLQKDIRVAFNNFKHDLVKITNLYSHSRILNSKIKYVNLNTF